MKRLTPKGITKYLINEYGECRHNPDAMYAASVETAKETGFTPLEVFRFVIGEGRPAGLTSYGFHTVAGRYVINHFKSEYEKF